MDINTEETEINYVGSFRRGFAISIDIFIVAVLRIFAAQILGAIWLNRVLSQLVIDFREYFGTDSVENYEQVDFILRHSAFKEVIIFYLLVFLVGALYHSYLNSSAWRATIGKRLLGIMIVDKNLQKISMMKGLAHYFLSIIPILYVIYLIFYQSYYKLGFMATLTGNPFNLILGFIAVMWLNIHVFTKRKVTAYDLICKTVFIKGRISAKYPWQKNN